jgi:redox-sensitive bicupin YhaK (pirin superfamily)
MNDRPIARLARGEPASEGAGVRINRLIGTPALRTLDPFLMLDYFDSDRPDDYLAGFPDHPHRGFETVTYMLAGRLRHRDNTGREGVIQSGGVQWMTAGRGIVHSEMPEQENGLMRGFQLWVNLPARLKMSAPGYQEFGPERFPVEARAGGVSVKIVAGPGSPLAASATEARFYDVTLPAGARFVEPLPAGHSAALVVYEGAVSVGDVHAEALSVAALGEGERVAATAGPDGARLLLLAGRPLNEPVAWGGPFVMNSREEVMQAYDDYRAGRF